MNNIVTWEYYNSLYNRAKQEDFSKLEALAEKQVMLVIGHYKWNHIQESAFYYNQLKDCICKVIDKLIDLESSGAGKGIASVSNDGYSETYVVRTTDEFEREIRICISHWLSGTGLTSAFMWGG